MKKKKTIIAIITLLLVVTIGATFAYFQSSSSFTNIFNTGTYRVVTTETFESPANWAPGQEIPKTITSTNQGTIDAAVRVSYTEQWLDSNNQDITSTIPSGTVTINLDHTNYWIQEGNYYYYKYILEPQQTTKSFIKSVTLNSQLGSGIDMQCTTSQDGLVQECSSTSSVFGATYKLIITKETVQADKYQELWNTNVEITKRPFVEIVTANRTKDTLQVGDEICVNGTTEECFNFIRYDGENNENIVMLSKYNLKVGGIYSSSGEKIGEYRNSDIGYGLQSNQALGIVSGQTSYGTVLFARTYYWYNGSTLNPKYGSSYPADVYDTDYMDAPGGDNYSVAYYVENYKDKLETYGLTVQSARLLTYSEATDSSIGCNGSSYSCPTTGFITNTSFWLGSARSKYYSWMIYKNGYFYYSTDYGNGVRPVIVISKNEIR